MEQKENNIYIVEDDRTMRENLRTLLEHNGYIVQVLEDFSAPVESILAASANLILLDLNLPHADGRFICREIRRESNIPIIVVTGDDSDLDELICLNFGADDFIAKPYNPQVLLAHVASVLKRTASSVATPAHHTVGGVSLDAECCRVSFAGKQADLTKNELRILSLLMRNAGKIVPRERIQEELWNSDEFIDDNTLTVNVSHLRHTLSTIGADDFIRTKRGIGYSFEVAPSESSKSSYSTELSQLSHADETGCQAMDYKSPQSGRSHLGAS